MRQNFPVAYLNLLRASKQQDEVAWKQVCLRYLCKWQQPFPYVPLHQPVFIRPHARLQWMEQHNWPCARSVMPSGGALNRRCVGHATTHSPFHFLHISFQRRSPTIDQYRPKQRLRNGPISFIFCSREAPWGWDSID